MKQTIFVMEEIDQKVAHETIDNIFSVACFEHIYDLPEALGARYKCSRKEAAFILLCAHLFTY